MASRISQQQTAEVTTDSRPERITDVGALVERYRRIRRQTEILCSPLRTEDFMLQAMPEVSPPKWHLAHTTWFFETLLLKAFQPGYTCVDDAYQTLFNSYYRSVNTPFSRERRGLLSRPDIEQVFSYRRTIDERVCAFLSSLPPRRQAPVMQRLELGLHHEQQHQELLLTDIKYSFSLNPLLPAYLTEPEIQLRAAMHPGKIVWCHFNGGVGGMGADPAQGFCFDNETPHHRILLQPYELADRLVTNREYLKFIEDGGYQRPEFWLADGWSKVQAEGWQAPLYWSTRDGKWQSFTWYGPRPLALAEPVCHISFYEADAYARWADARLPTEAEWEGAARQQKFEGHFLDDGVLHPRPPCSNVPGPRQMFGDAWEWTASAYAPYPGFRVCAGAVGEYNGKFMCNQMVLRGGSCISERDHLRATYRNFFYPWDRWQVSGLRLARNADAMD